MFTLTHTGVTVSNTDRSVRFYCDLLQCTLVDSYENGQIKLSYLQSGSQTIELIEHLTSNTRPATGVINHLAFTVADLTAAMVRLTAAGIVFGPEQPRLINHKKFVFFAGPDGERLELIES